MLLKMYTTVPIQYLAKSFGVLNPSSCELWCNHRVNSSPWWPLSFDTRYQVVRINFTINHTVAIRIVTMGTKVFPNWSSFCLTAICPRHWIGKGYGRVNISHGFFQVVVWPPVTRQEFARFVLRGPPCPMKFCKVFNVTMSVQLLPGVRHSVLLWLR